MVYLLIRNISCSQVFRNSLDINMHWMTLSQMECSMFNCPAYHYSTPLPNHMRHAHRKLGTHSPEFWQGVFLQSSNAPVVVITRKQATGDWRSIKTREDALKTHVLKIGQNCEKDFLKFTLLYRMLHCQVFTYWYILRFELYVRLETCDLKCK